MFSGIAMGVVTFACAMDTMEHLLLLEKNKILYLIIFSDHATSPTIMRQAWAEDADCTEP
jgi:hypothetical protein